VVHFRSNTPRGYLPGTQMKDPNGHFDDWSTGSGSQSYGSSVTKESHLIPMQTCFCNFSMSLWTQKVRLGDYGSSQ
jgi:hypothetical protein